MTREPNLHNVYIQCVLAVHWSMSREILLVVLPTARLYVWSGDLHSSTSGRGFLFFFFLRIKYSGHELDIF